MPELTPIAFPPKPASRKRIRAHANPLSDESTAPLQPSAVDWSLHYPLLSEKRVTIADVGCGFGGMLVGLAPHFPNDLILGLEIRDRVVALVAERIQKLREDAKQQQNNESMTDDNSIQENGSQHEHAFVAHPCDYQNISVVKTNIMRYCVNFFEKGQLSKMFILFADPHFKRSNYRRRVINPEFLALYAYVLRVGGLLYTVTDVKDLYDWNTKHCDGHPLFQRLSEDELKSDICVDLMCNATEEGQKVTRLNGQKFVAVYRRIASSES